MPRSDGQYKKGQSGNPAGRTPGAVTLIKKITSETIEVMIDRLSALSLEELRLIAEAKTTPSLEVALISIMLQAVKRGDHARIDFFFNRSAAGKVREKIELTVPKPFIVRDTDGNTVVTMGTEEKK